jgi:hypothetical protein
VLPVGRVDLRVRSQRVLERAERLSGGEEETAGDDVVTDLPDLLDGCTKGREGESARAPLAAPEEGFRSGKPDLPGRVVGLFRAGNGRVRDLDPAPEEDFGREQITGDGDEGRPARMGAETEGCRDRGGKSLMARNSGLPAVL